MKRIVIGFALTVFLWPPAFALGKDKILSHLGKVPCPPGSTSVGQRPPEGLREGCETAAGKKVGVWTEWYHSGGPRQRGRFVDGLEEGPWVQWHSNGEVRIQGEFRAGALHGEMRSFYTNGVLNELGTWKRGRAEGRPALISQPVR